jgi:Protein of unknown function (DUF419).
MTIDEVRAFALSLANAVEAPHHDRTSFRVRGKIFATAPQNGESLNVFVDDESAYAAVAENPDACELLHWGKKLVGVKITLAHSDSNAVREFLEESWERRNA